MATVKTVTYTEPQTGRKYTYLPNPWTRQDGVTVSPLNPRNCAAFGWTVTETETQVQEDEEPSTGPVLYSKLKLMRACRERGIWDEVKQGITDAGYMDEFMLAQDLSPEDEGFMRLVDGLRLEYGDETVDAILAGSLLE